jgi:hypothetical protein
MEEIEKKFIYNLCDITEWKEKHTIDYSVINTKQSGNYVVVQYDKSLLSFASPEVRLIRSVICNDLNEVLSICPSKSLPYEYFEKEIKYEDVIAEEFVDGTMINVFWDKNLGINGSWEITTRSVVGANISFYKSSCGKEKIPSFREMFLEAAKLNNLDFECLNKKYNYSFVLQHPNNRIVVPFIEPQLYLVQVHEIENILESVETSTQVQEINIYMIPMEEVKKFKIWENTKIKFPEIYKNFKSYEELRERFASINTPYNIMGVVLYDKNTLRRTKMRNPVYEYVRRLRGNQSKLQYQYLCLRKEGKVSEYLNYYPENKKEFSYYRDLVHDFTCGLYKNYISCYIRKEKPLNEFSEQFKTHMFKIHQIYIEKLKPNNLYIKNNNIIEYVNSLHPNLLMYSINYAFRKRSEDIHVEANTS